MTIRTTTVSETVRSTRASLARGLLVAALTWMWMLMLVMVPFGAVMTWVASLVIRGKLA